MSCSRNVCAEGKYNVYTICMYVNVLSSIWWYIGRQFKPSVDALTYVMLYLWCLLAVTPSMPNVTAIGLIVEQQSASRITQCISHGFRPKSVNVTWMLSGESPVTDSNLTVVNDTSPETFRLTSYFSRSVTRQDNGKVLSCSLNHETLQSPVSGNMTLDVLCKCIFRYIIPYINVFLICVY